MKSAFSGKTIPNGGTAKAGNPARSIHIYKIPGGTARFLGKNEGFFEKPFFLFLRLSLAGNRWREFQCQKGVQDKRIPF